MASPIQPNPDFLSEIEAYESCLGKGAFGLVLKAIDTFDFPTAIKFIFLDIDKDSDRKKLLREYNVTKDLGQHANIVKIINVQDKTFSSTEIKEMLKDIPSIAELRAQYSVRAKTRNGKGLETFCIHMELCGENLRQWLNLKQNATDLHIKIRQSRIVQGMISGLKYLHDNKIIHRDLKPENIMFSKDGYQLPVKIGDFGHSRKIHSEETETASLTSGVGTRTYMAPEVYSGDHYDHQADLYSLGLIIWEVSQFIGTNNIRHLFDKLVNEKKEDLVADHSVMIGIKEIIIGLTKRRTTERAKTLNDSDIYIWYQELQDCLLILESISNCKKNLTAKTSQGLKICLDNAQPGCIINLEDGEYFGAFVLKVDDVQIVGNGAGTVLRSVDDGNYCLKIVGSGCIISNLKVIKSAFGIRIRGSQNTIKQVEFNDMIVGIRIFGSQNTVDNVTMTNIKHTGIWVNSDRNTISNITGLNLRHGILMSGVVNNFTNINFQKGAGDDPSIGVVLCDGASHTMISNLICTGYSRDKKDWGLSAIQDSSNCTVVDSVCGPVWVYGSRNLTLTNVHCEELIVVYESREVELINCRGKMLERTKTVKLSHCQFEEEELID